MDISKYLEYSKSDKFSKSIGTSNEFGIHHFLKYVISLDDSYHEIKLDGFYVDVFIDNNIYEIQSKCFDKLRCKLASLLNNYKITICFPVVLKKIQQKVNDLGEIIERTSPKKELPIKLCSELYKIKEFLYHKNLNFKIFVIESKEVVKNRINRRKQIRLKVLSKEVTNIIDIIDINTISDFYKIIPSINNFKTKDFLKSTKLSKKEGYCALSTLRYLGIYEVLSKDKNSYIYSIGKNYE